MKRATQPERPAASIAFGAAWQRERDTAGPEAANDSSIAPRRKKLRRTFDRKAKPWMQPLLELPAHNGERMLELRSDVLSLSRADAARLLRVARNTIWDWETGYRSAPFSAFLALRLIADATAAREIEAPPKDDLPLPQFEPAVTETRPLEGRFVNRRQLAKDLQQRMLKFRSIYNAACLLRDAWHGPALRRAESARRMAVALAAELRQTSDHESLLYAVAESLYCSPLGVPWES